jgi:hypothetical protein
MSQTAADFFTRCRRADKLNLLYHAQRTLDLASDLLWPVEGAAIGDVITMLKIRRIFEIFPRLFHSRTRDCDHNAADDCPQEGRVNLQP